MTEHSKDATPAPASHYERPTVRDLGSLTELTQGNKNAPRDPDGAFGDFPIGS